MMNRNDRAWHQYFVGIAQGLSPNEYVKVELRPIGHGYAIDAITAVGDLSDGGLSTSQ